MLDRVVYTVMALYVSTVAAIPFVLVAAALVWIVN